MNIRSEIILEIVKNERTYRFSMPLGASFVDCIETSKEITHHVLEMAKQADEQAKKAQEGNLDVKE